MKIKLSTAINFGIFILIFGVGFGMVFKRPLVQMIAQYADAAEIITAYAPIPLTDFYQEIQDLRNHPQHLKSAQR